MPCRLKTFSWWDTKSRHVSLDLNIKRHIMKWWWCSISKPEAGSQKKKIKCCTFDMGGIYLTHALILSAIFICSITCSKKETTQLFEIDSHTGRLGCWLPLAPLIWPTDIIIFPNCSPFRFYRHDFEWKARSRSIFEAIIAEQRNEEF